MRRPPTWSKCVGGKLRRGGCSPCGRWVLPKYEIKVALPICGRLLGPGSQTVLPKHACVCQCARCACNRRASWRRVCRGSTLPPSPPTPSLPGKAGLVGEWTDKNLFRAGRWLLLNAPHRSRTQPPGSRCQCTDGATTTREKNTHVDGSMGPDVATHAHTRVRALQGGGAAWSVEGRWP